ncbi:hypothetical protein V8J82_10770 [Gymnodinialimonas sp. 2305UL16-5]|uniref:hypothetical protein n=1 Tax=Gymnodinialimonas mytili TaxID=3126503 RepID=UPI0030A8EE63
MIGRAALICALSAGVASAQTADEVQAAATNMWLAVSTCFEHARSLNTLVPGFEAAGFSIGTDLDATTFQAFGVMGYLNPTHPNFFCSLQSEIVPFAVAQQVVADNLAAAFPNAQIGAAEPSIDNLGCPMRAVTLDGETYDLLFLNAGNGIVCSAPDTSAILFQ